MTETTILHAGPAEIALEASPPQATPKAPAAAPAAPAPAAEPGVIIDTRGRRLRLRELSLWDELALMSVAGDARSTNRAVAFNLMLCARVEMIDDAPVPLPGNETGLRGLVERVGREGVSAVLAHLSREDQPDAAAADLAQAKN